MSKRKNESNKKLKMKQKPKVHKRNTEFDETENEEDLEEELEDEESLEEDPEDEEELEDEEDLEEDPEDEEELEDEEDSEEDPEDEEELEDEEDLEEDPEDEESTEIENGQNKRKKNKKYKHKKSKFGKEANAESVVVNKKKTKNQVSEISKEVLQDFDSTLYKPINIEMHTRSIGKAGAASIINSPKNGKRFTISKKVMDKINSPKAVKISIGKNRIAILAAEEEDSEALRLGRIGAKGVIYSAELVKILTEKFDLDFSSRICITFDKVKYTVDGDQIVAEITMR